jgi:hypothetical protein
VPTPVLTREILASGTPATATILSVTNLGTIVELRPMVRFRLLVTADSDSASFELEVVQAVPRQMIGEFRVGDVVEIRLTADQAAGAVVLGGSLPPAPGL